MPLWVSGDASGHEVHSTIAASPSEAAIPLRMTLRVGQYCRDGTGKSASRFTRNTPPKPSLNGAPLTATDFQGSQNPHPSQTRLGWGHYHVFSAQRPRSKLGSGGGSPRLQLLKSQTLHR